MGMPRLLWLADRQMGRLGSWAGASLSLGAGLPTYNDNSNTNANNSDSSTKTRITELIYDPIRERASEREEGELAVVVVVLQQSCISGRASASSYSKRPRAPLPATPAARINAAA